MDTARTRTPQETWDIALGEIQVQVSRPNFRTWFKKTSGLACTDEVFTIGVPNTFAAEYLEKNQRSLIEKVLLGITGPGVAVAFQVNGNGSKPASAATLPQPEPSFTRLNPHYTFDTFVEGAGNRLARAAAVAVAQSPGHSYNPLFIHGGAGLGKTHLLHAIGREAAGRHINVICTSAEQFTNEFVTALREHTTEEFRAKYRSIGMLLIDDIHFISGKEQTEESFFHTFNELHNTNRQIVMTSDRPPKSMPLLEERLRSRFEWGLIVDIQPPDFETRLAILESKALQKGIRLERPVLEMIAKDARPNVRTIEGMLNRVIAYARLLRVVPTPEIAAQALEDVSMKEVTAESVTPASIIGAVADSFQLSIDELLGRKRDKETSMARRLAMYLMRQETNFSLAQIGRELGNRDAAAVTSACRLIADNIATSPYLKRKIRDIQRSLNPSGDASRNN